MFTFRYDQNAFHPASTNLVCNLFSQPFLNLHSLRIFFNKTDQFGNSKYFACRNVSYMYFSKKRKHVMFAHTIKLDVFSDNRVCSLSESNIKLRIYFVSTKYFFVHLGHSSGGPN